MSEAENSYLPQELVNQILLRLPVKTLVRFKCVCKIWYAFFRNPNFISQHFDLHQNTHESLLLYPKEDSTHVVSLLTLTHPQTSINIDLPQSVKDLHNGRLFLRLLGPIYGVVCLYFGRNIGLWNPSTRDFNSLPQTPVPRGSNHRHVVGFGFHNNCFIIVRIILYIKRFIRSWVVEVYNSSMGCWREMDEDFPSNLSNLFASNVYLNGVCHWRASYYNDREAILSFDNGAQVFKKIPGPRAFHDLDELGQLVVVNGCIGLIAEDVDDSCFSMWVMTEYGVVESWTMLYKIGHFSLVSRPMGVLKKGELLLATQRTLVCYDSKTHATRSFQVRGRSSTMEFISYRESLVSVKGGNVV